MNPASDTWAAQLIFPPWIADEGRDGVLYNRAFHAGRAWPQALSHCCECNIWATRLCRFCELRNDAGTQSAGALSFAPVSSLHATGDTDA